LDGFHGSLAGRMRRLPALMETYNWTTFAAAPC
jgi:hypothetical protein